MSEDHADYKPAELGHLCQWVRSCFEPLWKKAQVGDEFSGDLAWIRNILVSLERYLQQSSDEQIADLTELDPNFVRIEFTRAVDEFKSYER